MNSNYSEHVNDDLHGSGDSKKKKRGVEFKGAFDWEIRI